MDYHLFNPFRGNKNIQNVGHTEKQKKLKLNATYYKCVKEKDGYLSTLWYFMSNKKKKHKTVS